MPVYCNKEYVKVMRPLPSFIKRDIYDIPFIEKDEVDITNLNNGKWLISMKNLSKNDRYGNRKIVQSFSYDDLLRREYNSMYKYLGKISHYSVVTSFDFTMDSKMDFHGVYDATYCNRWSGAFMQSHGKKVLPTVGWVGKEYDDICFAGLRDGSVFVISTLGVKNELSYNEYLRGYHEMRNRFPKSQIICVGNALEEMDKDVCVIPYKDSFGYWDRKSPYWQRKLFNWDGSIVDFEEVI